MHSLEPRVDVTLLATPDAINRSLHIVIDAAPRDSAEHTEGMPMRIEQHLMRLQWICVHQECSAVRELRMGRLQLDPFTIDIGPIFAPVELERLAGWNTKGTNVPRPVVCST